MAPSKVRRSSANPCTRSRSVNATRANPSISTPSKGGSLSPLLTAKGRITRASSRSTGAVRHPGTPPKTSESSRMRTRSTSSFISPLDIIVIPSDSESDDEPFLGPTKARVDEKKLMKLEKEKGALKKSYDEMKQDLRRVRKELQTKSYELAIKNDEAEDLLENAKDLEAQKAELRAELATARVKAERVKKEKALLQQQMAKKGKGKRLLDEDEWEEAIQCIICALTMWAPTSTQCGHTFCSDCLQTWLRDIREQHAARHPEYFRGFVGPVVLEQTAGMQTSAENPLFVRDTNRDSIIIQARQSLSRLKEEWDARNPAPKYSCPVCRQLLTKAPVSVLLVKDMVAKVAKLMGEEEPTQDATGHHNLNAQNRTWTDFFPAH